MKVYRLINKDTIKNVPRHSEDLSNNSGMYFKAIAAVGQFGNYSN